MGKTQGRKSGKHPGGRPTKYRKEFCEQAHKLCLLGATNPKLADFFEVAESTISKWMVDHEEFSEALKSGREQADAEIAQALFHRAKGYSHPEDKIFLGANNKPVIVHTTRHYPPETGAAFIWLKNRAGWRDRHEHQIDASKEMRELLGWIGGRNGGNHADDDTDD